MVVWNLLLILKNILHEFPTFCPLVHLVYTFAYNSESESVSSIKTCLFRKQYCTRFTYK